MKPPTEQLSRHLDDPNEIEHDNVEHRQLSMPCVRDHIWIISSLVSVLTTNILMHVKLFYYPYTLLLATVSTALAYRTSCQIQSRLRKPVHHSDHELPRSREEVVAIISWTLSALINTTASLFLAYSAFYYASSPFFMVMILSLNIDVGRICSMLRKIIFRPIIKLLLMLVALFFVIRYEYRLSSGRIALCFATCLTAAFARLSHRNLRKASGPSAYTIHSVAFAILALVCIMCWSADKRWYQDMTISSSTLPLLGCNIIASSIAMHLGGHILVQLDQTEDTIRTVRRIDSTSLTAPAMVGLFGVLYKITARDIMLPIQQIIAYLVLCACLASMNRSSQAEEIDSDMILERLEPRLSSDSSTVIGEEESSLLEEDSDLEVSSQASTEYDGFTNESYLGAWLSRAFIAAGLVAWIMLVFKSLKILPDSSMLTSSPHLDIKYSAPRSLDIVVSYYDEPYEELARTVKYMLPSPSTVDSPRRVMVYNKGNSTKSNEIQEVINATIFEAYGSTEAIDVQKRINVGRESETYLAHIFEHYNDLAEHTIFVQASMHEPEVARKRLQDYFVKQTGFLSLSYVDNFCHDCNACRDQSVWRSVPSDLEWIYNLTCSAKGQVDSRCQNLVLNYNGQFVVSAARIRGNKPKVYADLRSSLVDPASFQHSPQYLSQIPEGNTDQMKKPYFGFTLERMWGVIMQCSDRRIADRCPSLMSGYFGRLGEIEDCQCLDEKNVAVS